LATSVKMEKMEAMHLEFKIKSLPKEEKIAALKKLAGKKLKVAIRVIEKNPFRKEILKAILRLWQVNLKKIYKNIPVHGSPERSAFRIVLEDDNNNFFVLEQILPKSVENKKTHIHDPLFFSKEKFSPYTAF